MSKDNNGADGNDDSATRIVGDKGTGDNDAATQIRSASPKTPTNDGETEVLDGATTLVDHPLDNDDGATQLVPPRPKDAQDDDGATRIFSGAPTPPGADADDGDVTQLRSAPAQAPGDAEETIESVDDSATVVQNTAAPGNPAQQQPSEAAHDRATAVESNNPDPAKTGSTTMLTPPQGGVTVRTGDTLDHRFVLEQELGRGGMSRVYRARDAVKERARDRNPYVAIKVLTGDFGAHPDSWIALQREVAKVQILAHPCIVTIHDFTIDNETGVPYAQMEQLKGESLEDLIDRYPLGIKDHALFEKIVMGIADGLEYAHRRGIVHADLKPSNVFITEEGDVKILDFGISRFVQGDAGDFFEESGMTALTPRYASPEMCEGSPAEPSDDLFALGIIAIELAGGQHPFIGDAFPDIKTAQDAREANIRTRRPALIRSNRQWRAVNAALQYERKERPENGAQFLQRFRRRSKVALASIAVSLVLVAAMSVYTIFYKVPEPEIPFEELPAETQTAVQGALDEASLAMRFGDTNGALVMLSRAFELHPYNRDAMDGFDTIVDDFLDQPAPANAAERSERLEQVEILLQYDALDDSRALRRYRDKLASGG